MKACALCRFYSGDSDSGICNRYPPNVVDTKIGMGQFVPVSGHWWCGEFVDANREDRVARRYDAVGSLLVDEFTRAQYGTTL